MPEAMFLTIPGAIPSPTMADQSRIPLLETLQTLAQRQRANFHTPGHKQGQGSPVVLKALLQETLRADLPELPELDNLFAPADVIQQAQNLAADAFGAEHTWFLANGSTCGIEAAVLATCRPGEQIIVSRNAHRSVISALILAGAVPVWLEPAYDPTWQLPTGVSLERLQTALTQHPQAKAVLIVSPTYHGCCSDLAAIADLVHQFNRPLLVDEAHGAHFIFHPDLPTAALAAGVDLTVQSTHKTLAALTQAAMLHGQGNRIDWERLSQALQLVQSTSPNYLLLASLDGARYQMATEGKALMQQTLALAEQARSRLQKIPGLAVLTTAQGAFAIDPTRLTVDVTGLGLTGFAADEWLHQELNITAELPALRQLTFIVTPGNTQDDIDRLVQAFQTLAADFTNPANSADSAEQAIAVNSTLPNLPLAPQRCSPRDAFFAAATLLPAEAAIDRTSAELICPYPPGIPVLFPGEGITAVAIQYLQLILAQGGVLTGCTDSTLSQLKVLQE
jgi:arginine decarboxylase